MFITTARNVQKVKVINLITKAMENWKLEIAAEEPSLVETKIQRDSLSALNFL